MMVQAELLELVAKDEKAQEVKRAKKKGKKKGGRGEALTPWPKFSASSI